MTEHTKGRLQAVIYRHAGQPDTVCLKDDRGNELVNWMGFDGNVYTKAVTRANAKRLAAGWNALDEAAETILALRNALRACRNAVGHGNPEPRRNVREIVDEALGPDRAALATEAE